MLTFSILQAIMNTVYSCDVICDSKDQRLYSDTDERERERKSNCLKYTQHKHMHFLYVVRFVLFC